MGRIEKSIEVNTRPEKVWEMLAWDRFPEWEEGTRKDVKSMKYTTEVHTSEDKYRVGASAHMTTKKGEGYDLEITESTENKKIAYRTGYWGAIVTFLLEPLENRTKIIYAVDYEMPWGILGKFLEKLFFQRTGGKEFERSLENLKNVLEK